MPIFPKLIKTMRKADKADEADAFWPLRMAVYNWSLTLTKTMVKADKADAHIPKADQNHEKSW